MNNNAVIHGIRWNLVTTVIRRIFGLVFLLFIARWLNQSDIGHFRTYSLIILIASLLSVAGLDNQYITNKRKRLLSLFSFTQLGLLFGFVISIILVLSRSIFANLYQSQELGRIIAWTSLFVVVEVLRRRYQAEAQIKYLFRDIAIAETLNVVFYTVIGLFLLYHVRSLWLYITVFYLGNLIELLYLLFRINKNRYISLKRLFSLKYLAYSIANMKRNLSFQINTLLITLMNNFSGNAPVLWLGTIVAPEYMGLYYMATQIVGVPVNMFTSSVSRVFYPTFAQGERDSTLRSVKAYSRLTFGLGIPSLIFYCFIMQYLLIPVLGESWAGALPLINFLSIFFGMALLNSPVSSVPYVCRKPQWELYWNIITLIIRVAGLSIGIQYGFNAAIMIFAITSGVMYLCFYLMSVKLLEAKLRQEITELLLPITVNILFGLALWQVAAHIPFGWVVGIIMYGLFIGLNIAIDTKLRIDLIRVVKA